MISNSSKTLVNRQDAISNDLTALRAKGWVVKERTAGTGSSLLPPAIAARHPNLPQAVSEFLASLTDCHNEASTEWFLCASDYAGQSDSAFRWNEWEILATEAAVKDLNLIRSIQQFWDYHLPFMISVKDGYAYFAVRTAPDGFGQIVAGREPEFEEVSVVADNFESFLKSFITSQTS